MNIGHFLRPTAAALGALIVVFATALPATAKSTPTVEVTASLDLGYASASVVVGDLRTPSTLSWTLSGPVSEMNDSCFGLDWSQAPAMHSEFISIAGDGTYSIRPLHVGNPGCYTYSVRLWETTYTEEVLFAAGLETLRFAPLGPTVPSTSYPIDRGIVQLTSQAAAGGPVSTLQETGDVYVHHPDARNVVASPGWWGISQQKWRLIQTGTDTYRFLTLDGERALQSTYDFADLPLHETSDPAYASPRFNVVTTPASWNIDQQQIRVAPVPGGNGNTVVLWGVVRSGEQRIEVTGFGYLGIPGVSLVGTGPGAIAWTVTGYTFP